MFPLVMMKAKMFLTCDECAHRCWPVTGRLAANCETLLSLVTFVKVPRSYQMLIRRLPVKLLPSRVFFVTVIKQTFWNYINGKVTYSYSHFFVVVYIWRKITHHG